MTTTSNDKDTIRSQQRAGDGSILPLAIRQRLWDQLWTRLLAPPHAGGDKAPAPRNPNNQDGGQR